MKWLGVFIVAGTIIAAAQAVAIVLGLLVVIGLVISLFTCPRELFGLIILCTVAGFIQAQPLVCAGLTALLIVGKLIHKAIDDSDRPS